MTDLNRLFAVIRVKSVVRRLPLAAILLAVAWPVAALAGACVEQPDAATAVVAMGGGIGGTGDPARDGGIGGTGIVGTVTGFGSVCVNGLEIDYGSTTPVTRNGRPATVTALALGQIVAIEAGQGERGLSARRIGILDILEGPVTGVAADEGVLRVMGQAVRIDAATRMGGLASPAEVRVGMSLRIAGFRDPGGEVRATRVERAPEGTEGSAIGSLTLAGGAVALDGLPVRVEAEPPTAGEVMLRGRWDGRHLVAAEVRANPYRPFAGRVDRVVVEGVVLERAGRGRLRIAGFDVELPGERMAAGPAEGQRIRVTGRLEDGGRIVARALEINAGPRDNPRSHGAAERGMAERGAMEPRGAPERPPRLERLDRIEHIPPRRPDGPMPGPRR